jgi:Bacterial SH3 domain
MNGKTQEIVSAIVVSSLVSIAVNSLTPAIAQIPQSEIDRGVRTRSCQVANISSGQLALRKSPGGKVIGRLNNGDKLTKFGRGLPRWVYVNVERNNQSGYVSSQYLSCDDE